MAFARRCNRSPQKRQASGLTRVTSVLSVAENLKARVIMRRTSAKMRNAREHITELNFRSGARGSNGRVGIYAVLDRHGGVLVSYGVGAKKKVDLRAE